MKLTIQLAKWAYAFYESKFRYNILWGGRGSGKSYTIADILILRAYREKKVILCGREYLKDLSYSVHTLLKIRIEAMGLSEYFIFKHNEIICIHNGSRFFYAGLRMNIEGLKSIPDITDLWIEEADTLSAHSWLVIVPTIRTKGSQIWVSLNPKNKEDCLYQQFIADPEPDRALVKKVNWDINPFFPEILNDERKSNLKKMDADLYRHIWEGEPILHSDALIFKNKWVVDDFEEDNEVYAYYGLDFGHVDPTAAVRCYIKGNTLYVTHEYYKRGVELNHIGIDCEETILDFKNSKIIADNSRPETISYMVRQGYNVKACEKGKGSVEDGIAFLRSFDKIVVHPRCENMIKEFGLYSYKIDPHSGDITAKIIDADNHLVDALRYALEKMMKCKFADYSVLAKW